MPRQLRDRENEIAKRLTEELDLSERSPFDEGNTMTTTTHVTALDHSIECTNVWLHELGQELGSDDPQYAYRVLRAFLHNLRDRISLQETAQLAAQLPDLIRGIYYEGWNPSHTPAVYHDAKTFFDRVSAEAVMHGDTEASFATMAAARVLRRHVSAGEIEDVLAVLPREIRAALTD